MSDLEVVGLAVGVLGVVAAVVVPVLIYMKQRVYKRLYCTVFDVGRIARVPDYLREDLVITYKGSVVFGVCAFVVRVENVGTMPIQLGDYEVPVSISFSGGGQILSTQFVKVQPPELRAEGSSSGKCFVLRLGVMNSGDFVDVRVVTDQAIAVDDVSVSGRIVGGDIRKSSISDKYLSRLSLLVLAGAVFAFVVLRNQSFPMIGIFFCYAVFAVSYALFTWFEENKFKKK